MFELINQYKFEIAFTASIIVIGAIFLEACCRMATNDLIVSDKWIKSRLSKIKDGEVRTLVKERLIDHTGSQARVLTRSDFSEIYRKSRTSILASRQNAALAEIS